MRDGEGWASEGQREEGLNERERRGPGKRAGSTEGREKDMVGTQGPQGGGHTLVRKKEGESVGEKGGRGERRGWTRSIRCPPLCKCLDII